MRESGAQIGTNQLTALIEKTHLPAQQIRYFALKQRMFPSMWTHFDFAPTIEFDFVREVLQPFVFANFQPVHAANLSPPASHASGKQSRWAAPRKAYLEASFNTAAVCV